MFSFTVQVARNTSKLLNWTEIVGLYVIKTAQLSNLIHIFGTCTRTESYPYDDLQNIWSFTNLQMFWWFRFRSGASSENANQIVYLSLFIGRKILSVTMSAYRSCVQVCLLHSAEKFAAVLPVGAGRGGTPSILLCY